MSRSISKQTNGLAVVLLLTITALSGCGEGDDEPTNIQHEAGTITAPGATIIVGGEVFEETASVPDNALVAVELDGIVYLYHPALGDRLLSEETNRRAVGAFLASAGEEPASEPAFKDRRTLGPTSSAINATTGVRITLNSETGRVQLANQSRRWTAVTADWDGAPAMLLPLGNAVPTGIVDALISDLGPESWDGSTDTLPVHQYLRTYGAVMRSFPHFLTNLSVVATAWEAYQIEPDLFVYLNVVDFVHTAAEGAKSLLGLIPLECFDGLITNQLVNAVRDQLLRYIGPDAAAADVSGDLFREAAKELSDSLSVCLAEAGGALASPWLAVAIEALSTFLDIIAVGNWIVDRVVAGAFEMAYLYDAFELIDVIKGVDIQDYANLSAQTQWDEPDDQLVAVVQQDLGIAAWAGQARSVTVDLSELDGDSELELTRTFPDSPDSWGFSGTFPVTPMTLGERVVTATATLDDGSTFTDTVAIPVRGAAIYEGVIAITDTVEWGGSDAPPDVSCSGSGLMRVALDPARRDILVFLEVSSCGVDFEENTCECEAHDLTMTSCNIHYVVDREWGSTLYAKIGRFNQYLPISVQSDGDTFYASQTGDFEVFYNVPGGANRVAYVEETVSFSVSLVGEVLPGSYAPAL